MLGTLEPGDRLLVSELSRLGRSLSQKRTLHREVEKHVEAGSALYSDDLRSYDGLAGKYSHQVIDHAVAFAGLDEVLPHLRFQRPRLHGPRLKLRSVGARGRPPGHKLPTLPRLCG